MTSAPDLDPSFSGEVQAPPENGALSPFRHFTAAQWAELRKDTPLALSEAELAALRGRGERVSLDEVRMIYLPLSRLLNLYVAATQELNRATSAFLGRKHAKVPYIIGVAGSVAVGKSTLSRILRTLLARWPNHPKVDLLITDGFLYSNHVLEERGLLGRKGFPESFNLKALVAALADIKGGTPKVEVPVYSHDLYDIVPGRTVAIEQADIIIVEGLNVLQGSASLPSARGIAHPFVSDFFDFKIFLDADEQAIRGWYIDRFLSLRGTSFQDPRAYFHRYASLSDEAAAEVAYTIWTAINLPNLRLNILPTRSRADLVLRKAPDHTIRDVWLRKL